MARPSIRRELKRQGLAPAEKPGKPARGANRGAAPEPPIWLSGEQPGAPQVDFAALFGRRAPVELEIGTGKGRFLVSEAAAHPERDFLGLEIAAEYARIARARAERRGLTNLRVERADGKLFVLKRIPRGALARLHVFFPDPWPKKRHRKRRLFDAAFAAGAAGALERGGLLRVASDHQEYFAAILTVLDAEPLLARLPEAEIGEWLCGTNYEAKFLERGQAIGKAVYRRS
jgi:tRNA (guanine-N7-)-methyltransferase